MSEEESMRKEQRNKSRSEWSYELFHTNNNSNNKVNVCEREPIKKFFFCFLGTLLLKKQQFSEAEKIYRGLIKRNPENHSYYQQLAAALQADTAEQKLSLFQDMKEQYPKAQAPQRLALDVAEGKKNITHLADFKSFLWRTKASQSNLLNPCD